MDLLIQVVYIKENYQEDSVSLNTLQRKKKDGVCALKKDKIKFKILTFQNPQA